MGGCITICSDVSQVFFGPTEALVVLNKMWPLVIRYRTRMRVRIAQTLDPTDVAVSSERTSHANLIKQAQASTVQAQQALANHNSSHALPAFRRVVYADPTSNVELTRCETRVA